MKKLNVLKLVSSDINICIPRDANLKYNGSLEEIKNKLLNGKFAGFVKGLEITEEEIEIPRPDFSSKIFRCRDLDILCYQGFGYPRHSKRGDVFYACWEIFEFGTWGLNENHYYDDSGEFVKIEKY